MREFLRKLGWLRRRARKKAGLREELEFHLAAWSAPPTRRLCASGKRQAGPRNRARTTWTKRLTGRRATRAAFLSARLAGSRVSVACQTPYHASASCLGFTGRDSPEAAATASQSARAGTRANSLGSSL